MGLLLDTKGCPVFEVGLAEIAFDGPALVVAIDCTNVVPFGGEAQTYRHSECAACSDVPWGTRLLFVLFSQSNAEENDARNERDSPQRFERLPGPHGARRCVGVAELILDVSAVHFTTVLMKPRPIDCVAALDFERRAEAHFRMCSASGQRERREG